MWKSRRPGFGHNQRCVAFVVDGIVSENKALVKT